MRYCYVSQILQKVGKKTRNDEIFNWELLSPNKIPKYWYQWLQWAVRPEPLILMETNPFADILLILSVGWWSTSGGAVWYVVLLYGVWRTHIFRKFRLGLAYLAGKKYQAWWTTIGGALWYLVLVYAVWRTHSRTLDIDRHQKLTPTLTKFPVAGLHCYPESFCASGKFLRIW